MYYLLYRAPSITLSLTLKNLINYYNIVQCRYVKSFLSFLYKCLKENLKLYVNGRCKRGPRKCRNGGGYMLLKRGLLTETGNKEGYFCTDVEDKRRGPFKGWSPSHLPPPPPPPPPPLPLPPPPPPVFTNSWQMDE